nr:ribonuclease H-like domain-containing protein [Tanacetum cinerariifolium]
MAILDEHLARFHGIKNAKTLWAAIKTRFSGNAESKKMQKNVLKQQFEIFFVSNSEGLDKGSLPLAWINISLIMRNKPYIDTLDIDDLYNNLKVYKANIKGSSGSSSNSQNVAFVYAESTSSTNELNAAYSVSTVTGHSSQAKVRNSGNKSRDARNAGYKRRDNGKRPAKEKDKNALVVQDGLGYDSQFNEKEVLDIKVEEVTEIVFDNRSSDEEHNVANDRFKKCEGYHAVPPPLTRNYMPPKPDLSFAGLDDSIYKFKISETVTSLAKDEKDAPKTSTAYVEKPKEDRSSTPFIKDWETNSDDGSVFAPEPIPAKIYFVKAGESIKHVKLVESIKHVKPVESVKHVKHVTPIKTAEQTKKSKNFSSSPKVNRKNWNGKMTQKL